MAEEENEAEGGGGGKKKLIILIVIGMLLVGLSVGGTIFALQMLADPEPVAEGEEGEAEEAAAPKLPAVYFPLKPAIIVNFNARGRQRYLQAEVTLKIRDPEVVAAVELHMSMIRNALVMLFSGQVYDELQTPEGRELMRQQALEEIQRIVESEIGKPGVEQVLFTNFVMQ
ncbi:flagellar basal body-associated FliL family protein [Simiduia sp. 21SJ11W-1]|uniref:flagellar basal body-associated FliL family protein n=1 Tax=Simiduia sp. 21SJ11W-1 TaxID=2909669 RepID=UPI00209DF32B|nr:flagellar basal body-associated FliL family protein [Simiduia sp. 21SJ11W-1]UTA49492.1 flagellar basal body-associated FliL family protein [Simiduia sp. 21SJ11W-1]